MADLFLGTTVPNDITGANGDVYIRSTGDYYQKTSGTWGDPVFNILQGKKTSQETELTADLIDGTVQTRVIKGGANWRVKNSSLLSWLQTQSPAFRQGAGAPSNSLGGNGDSYLDITTGQLYLRASGTYSPTIQFPING